VNCVFQDQRSRPLSKANPSQSARADTHACELRIGKVRPSSTLAPAEIQAALAYYHLHRDEIESYLEQEREACRSLERKPSTPT
jgi:hypothetical protein